MQAYDFIQKVKHSQAFNLPSGVKKIWSNQYASGYLFNDGSFFKFLKKASFESWGQYEVYDSRNGNGLCAGLFLCHHVIKQYNHNFKYNFINNN